MSSVYLSDFSHSLLSVCFIHSTQIFETKRREAVGNKLLGGWTFFMVNISDLTCFNKELGTEFMVNAMILNIFFFILE